MEFSMEQLAPYLFQTVLLTLEDNFSIEGELTQTRPDSVDLAVIRRRILAGSAQEDVQEDVLTFPLAELRDIECLDEVKEYRNFAEKVDLRSGYQFALSDLVPETDPKLIVYGDRTCRVAYHVEKAGDRLMVRDVRVLCAVYKHNSLMSSCNLLYFLEDGRRLVGHLDDGVLVTPKGEKTELEMVDIRDVSKPAELNDYVFVTLSGGQTAKGVVSKADPEFFVVDGKRYFYKDVDGLRFRGTVRIGLNSRDPKRRVTNICLPSGELYQYRRAYYRDPGMEAIATDGAQAIFSAGIGDKGKIAKDIEVVADPGAKPVGLVLMFPRGQKLGYIGDTFAAAKEDQKPGNISFTADDMGDFSPLPGQIYAAEYTCAQKSSATTMPVISVTFKPTGYTRDEYARVWVENGEIHAEKRTSSRKEAGGPCVLLGDFLVGKLVELVVKDGGGERAVFGRVTDCAPDQGAVTLETPVAAEQTFFRDDIAQLRLYGQITQWFKRGFGYLCGSNGIYFHISNVRNAGADEQYIDRGVWASFALRPSKGTIEACDVFIAHTRRLGWLKEYQSGSNMAAIFPQVFRDDESLELQPLVHVREDMIDSLVRAGADAPSLGCCAVQYVLLEGGRENYRVLLNIAPGSRRHLGFLCHTERQGNQMVKGHVAPMAAWRDYLSGRTLKEKYYFMPTPLRSPTTGERPDADVCSYWVSYVRYQVEGKNFEAARDITILAERPELPDAAGVSNDDLSPAVPEEILDLSENLAGVLADKETAAEVSWKLGLIWTWGWGEGHPTKIRTSVFNRAAPENLKERSSSEVLFYPEDTQVLTEDAVKSTELYLVRYVEASPCAGGRRVDTRYPVRVLKAFPKSDYIALTLRDDTVPVLYVHRFPKQEKAASVSEFIETRPLPLIDGETVLLQRDGKLRKYTVKADGGEILLRSGSETEQEELTMDEITGLRLYRFGIVDAYDAQAGQGKINGSVDFSIGAVRQLAVHAIKTYPTNQSIRVQVLYACEGKRVVDVCAESENDIEAVGIQEPGTVTAVEPPKRVIINGLAECNLSGLTNSKINSFFKDNSLKGRQVCFRGVTYCTGEGKLGNLALDIRPIWDLELPQTDPAQSDAGPAGSGEFNDWKQVQRALHRSLSHPSLADAAYKALCRIATCEKLLQKEDLDRFQDLRECCFALREENVCKNTAKRIQQLDSIRQDLQDMLRDIRGSHSQHAGVLLWGPGPEGTEDLKDNLITRLTKLATDELNEKCEDPELAPKLSCTPINKVVADGSKSTFLHITNEGETSRTAESVKLTLMPTSVLYGFQETYPLGDIPGGDSRIVEVTWDGFDDPNAVKTIGFGWDLEYTENLSITGSNDDGSLPGGAQHLTGTAIELDVVEAVKKFPGDQPPENPYSYGGEALPPDTTLFFGREDEKRKIMGMITTENGKRLKPGSVVLVYGQKRCGKSSLIEQIKGDIQRSDELGQQAIILHYSDILTVGAAEIAKGAFLQALYRTVALDLLDEMPEDIKEKLSQKGITEDQFEDNSCDAVVVTKRFKALTKGFKELDEGKHCVVLIMDEFTRFITRLYSEYQKKPDLANQALFINSFADASFVQIIIGHEAMLRNLDKLDLTNSITHKASDTIKVTALQEGAACKMICEPINRALGRSEEHPVYDGKSGGEEAIRALCDLSGRSPYLLTKLCREMYDYYGGPEISVNQTWLSDVDVERVVGSYIKDRLEPVQFDMLIKEDGDPNVPTQQLPTYRYLKALALMSPDGEERWVKEVDLRKKLEESDLREGVKWTGTQVDEITKLLSDRDVIEKSEGAVRIIAGLFVRYIKEKEIVEDVLL